MSAWDEVDDITWDGKPAVSKGLLPEGNYRMRVVDHLFRTNDNGTPLINLELVVVGGDYDGRKQFHDFYLTEKAIAMTVRDVATLTGTLVKKASELQEINFNDCMAECSTYHNEYNDKKSSRIKWWSEAMATKDEPKVSNDFDDSDIPF